MIELTVLAVLAVVVLYRLYLVLGRHGGEPSSAPERAANISDARLRDVTAEADDAPPPARVDEVEGPARVIADRDPTFDPATFVRGAKAAYKMIVDDFGAGELQRIKPFIAGDVFKTFEGAVKQRRSDGHDVELEVERIEAVAIEDAKLRGDVARIRVRFEALVFEVVKDQDGRVVAGDATAAQQRSEVWTFERNLADDDPNWILAATGR